MNDDKHTIKSGHLDVGNGHNIYYQSWGNPAATPIFYLHGGPGGGLRDSNKLFFDPKENFVIFHDQRGSGNSTPFGKLEHNTTDDLVDDIEKLRKHLNLDKKKIHLFGGSWGSCLALIYAIKYPENVEKMLLSGIYAGTKHETDYIQQGGMSTHFPESWENYISVVPENRRSDSISYYFEKMQDKDQNVADNYIRRWNSNEVAGMSVDVDMRAILIESSDVDDRIRAVSLIEASYFINNCYIPENYISDNVSKIANIPSIFVQGRHDHVCPPETAWKLASAIGPKCRLHIVPGAHARGENTMREVIRAYVWSFLN